MGHDGVVVIDPGKLADAAAMRAREASDRLRRRGDGYSVGTLRAPIEGTRTEILEAASDEVREAFIAGVKWNREMTGIGAVAMIGEIAHAFGIGEPKTSDYCRKCGHSPDGGSHLPHGHEYEDPRISRPTALVPGDLALVDLAVQIELRAAELAAEAFDGRLGVSGLSVAESNGWEGNESSIICGPNDPGWRAGYLAHVIFRHLETS